MVEIRSLELVQLQLQVMKFLLHVLHITLICPMSGTATIVVARALITLIVVVAPVRSSKLIWSSPLVASRK
jgi:hypothetical protein